MTKSTTGTGFLTPAQRRRRLARIFRRVGFAFRMTAAAIALYLAWTLIYSVLASLDSRPFMGAIYMTAAILGAVALRLLRHL